MKKTRIFFAAALALIAASCNRAEIAQPGTELTITAYTGDTKTSILEDGKIYWEPGDKINIFYNGESSEFTSTLTASAAVSDFKGTLSVVYGYDETASNADFYAIYPYSSANTISSANVLTATLPSQQTAKAGTFAGDTYITVGKSATPSIGFYGVCGGIRFTLSREDITSVSFKGNNSEKLAGALSIEFGEDGIPAVTKVASATNVITLNAPEGETFKAGEWYYIVAAPATLEKGFTMTFNTADKTASKATESSVEIKRKTFGSMENVDSGLEFKERSWSNPTVINVDAGTLAFEINPSTDKPVLAMVRNDGSSRGPVLFYDDIKGAPVTVTPEANVNNQYVALGVDAAGKAYVYTQNYTTKKGEIYTSSDRVSWTKADVTIDQANAYYGATIGTIGSEAYMMTSNNANASVPKRNINVTRFNGTTWSTGSALANRASTPYGYFPVMRASKNVLYTFVTDVSQGLTIYKYDGSSWSSVISLNAVSGDYSKYGYGISEPQDMTIAPDGQIWIALGTSNPMGSAVIKIDPAETTDNVAQVGDLIPLTNSISARSSRIGINPVTGATYQVYRNNDQCLMVSRLDDDTWEWKAGEQLTQSAAGDIQIRFTAAGKGYIVCTTNDHVEIFETL